jgi:hypothetical protein
MPSKVEEPTPAFGDPSLRGMKRTHPVTLRMPPLCTKRIEKM